jgi:exodeoxyribonuclease V alpha subunit
MMAEPAVTAGGRDGRSTHPDRRVLRAPGLLAAWNDAAILTPADVHVAHRLSALVGEADASVALACALAVRATRLGHVCADLAEVATTVTSDLDPPADITALPWPEPADWVTAIGRSPLVGTADAADQQLPARPFRLDGTRLYLDRLWRQERQVARELLARAAAAAPALDEGLRQRTLEVLIPSEGAAGPGGDAQRRAAAAVVRGRLTVIAGGPGTGKTTTVARVLTLLDRLSVAEGTRPLRIGLAAPTGKAAAQLEEAVRTEARTLAGDDDDTRTRLLRVEATTLHRLLGWRPGDRSRFEHDRLRPLPHDVVVVDELSMVSLSLMAALVDAVRRDARLILVGDPGQLASVEAGAVLGDIVGPALQRPAVTGAPLRGNGGGGSARVGGDTSGSPLAERIVVLRRVHRFGGGIADLADAVQRGDGTAAMAVLRRGGVNGDVTFLDVDLRAADRSTWSATTAVLAPVRHAVVTAGRRVATAAAAGDAPAALAALGAMRVLCAHRRGPAGAQTWSAEIQRWLTAALPHEGRRLRVAGGWSIGEPLLVTRNDPVLGLSNGDVGVVVATGGGRVRAVFPGRTSLLEVAPSRLAAVSTVHAMTIHKSQGSQFTEVAVLLPDPASPVLTRELLFTGITRAQQRLTVVGTEASVRRAVARPVARGSGLRTALWSAPDRAAG